ncbi:hypothetical protein LXA43DRAFT_1182464 [Ganoderma leucocontextum]|nr:hypothetical protein LXA43DRAFT_1182464 [Ganoderma leucocontextum]
MANFLHPVQRLPPELVRRIADQLVGIREWVTLSKPEYPDTPPPEWTREYCAPPVRRIDYIGLRTLPSLATASHFFLEPTLDALWDTLPDYGILVYLLPRDAWAVDIVDELEDPNIPPEHKGPPFQYVDEFKRIEYYTPRVKRIQELCPLFPGRFRGCVTYESSVLAAFAPRWTPEKPLFPNLHILDVSPANDQYAVYYRFFHVLFGPQLQSISNDCITFSGMAKDVPPADYLQMLVRLQECAPHLLHLKLYVDVPPYSPIIVSAMSTAIRSFKHLVSAHTGSLPITEEVLHHLAELPHLEVINVSLLHTMTKRDVAPTRFNEFFPALRELRLAHHSNLVPISQIVQHVNSSRLEIIHATAVKKDVPVSLNTMLTFFSAVLARNNSDNIKELGIQASLDRMDEASQFTEQYLEPLFALKSLTHLRLRLSCTFNLDDAALDRAARAWPNIRVLELGPDSRQKDAPTLGFTFDADLSRLPADVRDSRASVGSGQRALQVLEVGRARIADPEGVAAFLIDLFPRLGYIRDDNSPFLAVFLAELENPQDRDEFAAEAKCRDLWKAVYGDYIPALARERGIDRAQTLDQSDTPVICMKSWQMGGRRRRLG